MHPDQRTRRPQLQTQVGMHPNQWLGCPSALAQSAPVSVYPNQWPGAHTWNLGWVHTQTSSWLPCAQAQSLGSVCNWSMAWLLVGDHTWSTSSEQLPPSPCPQSSAGPTGSLGGRQNAQHRGAAGLGETAFPGKTPTSRGLNYPKAAPEGP